MPRARPTTAQALIKAARQGQPFEPAKLPIKVTCPRCGRDQWPDEIGNPRYHERAARPGEAGYSPDMPTTVTCEEKSNG